nr:class I SAM-dependent methyltransferase [uncultured Rhodopila sp.]
MPGNLTGAAARDLQSLHPVTRRLSQRERDNTEPFHHAGSLSVDVIDYIEAQAGDGFAFSAETGCGRSTILLSNISAQHLVFSYDDRSHAESSVRYYEAHPIFRSDNVRSIFGPTQQTVPAFVFEHQLDFLLIDGPHGFPFPQLEYYYFYPHLKAGAILAIDDIHIPHIGDMFRLLAEDDMFEFLGIVTGTTGFLRRSSWATVDPCGDHWFAQRHNLMHFPQNLLRTALLQRGATIDFTATGNRDDFVLFGWSSAEGFGSWTDGNSASLSFLHSSESAGLGLKIVCAARCDVIVELNGVDVYTIRGYPEEAMREFCFDTGPGILHANQPNQLIFRPTQPFGHGEFPRNRRLGMAINRLDVL